VFDTLVNVTLEHVDVSTDSVCAYDGFCCCCCCLFFCVGGSLLSNRLMVNVSKSLCTLLRMRKVMIEAKKYKYYFTTTSLL